MKTKKSSVFEMLANTQSGPLRAKANGGRQGVEMGAASRSRAPSRNASGEYKNGGQEKRADTRSTTETNNP